MEPENIDDILNDTPAPEPAAEAPAEAAPETEQEGRARDEQGRFVSKGEQEPGDTAEPEGAPPAPEEESPHVPRTALQDERRKRQGLEQQLQELQQQFRQMQQVQTPPAPAPDLWENPEGWQQHFGENVTANAVNQAVNLSKIQMSEMLARQAHPDFQEKYDLFNELARENPAIAQQALQDPHPWNKAYQIATNHKTMQELGATDIDSLRASIRKELEAEAAASLQSQLSPAVPPSLATARNVGSRSGPAWAGPVPLTDLLHP